MNKKGLAILMRTKMRPSSAFDPNKVLSPPSTDEAKRMAEESEEKHSIERSMKHAVTGENSISSHKLLGSDNTGREIQRVKESMHSAISLNKTDVLDDVLNDFSEGFYSLSHENRRELLLVLAKDHDLNRIQVRELMKQYLDLELPSGNKGERDIEEEGLLSTFYRMEKNLRHALKPMYEVLFERLNTHPGGLKFLSVLRADILSIIENENAASLRALDSYLKEKLITWLSPASLELHRITWDDPASLLEKIVAYEAVHPISSLLDLKRRVGAGRRCFGYLHPAIPGEPLIFIEVSLMKNIAKTIQEVLWDDPPLPECEATCALFYSISSTQPGLAGINLGKFLIKRVIELVKREMPHISTFATLSPIPGFMKWLLSKLAYQLKFDEAETSEVSDSLKESAAAAFKENILEPEEEGVLINSFRESAAGKSGMEVLWNLLKSTNYEWTKSDALLQAIKPPLMRLCARYLLKEKRRGKALDSVANFHLQNGAIIERLNWMADRSEKGLAQSGGIMVNYIYMMDSIEENAQTYFSTGHINASFDINGIVEQT
ncbi:hypothetical protein Nepgr_007123 [Nepenthes gracilis]|uniref:Malonyl-CoA decarboxylase n=1 Tax=Nepenthes gracilis TaxID=150966 RepID=A0AAD3S695_NEPGR|nr:hypothetical protein Nepgr_007123 [Nepenthes gracilis]